MSLLPTVLTISRHKPRFILEEMVCMQRLNGFIFPFAVRVT